MPSPYLCRYSTAEMVVGWFNRNEIDGGVSKPPYDVWDSNPPVPPPLPGVPPSQVTEPTPAPANEPVPSPDQIAQWLVDTNGGAMGISCALIIDRIRRYGTVAAADMTKDELKQVESF